MICVLVSFLYFLYALLILNPSMKYSLGVQQKMFRCPVISSKQCALIKRNVLISDV